MKWIHLKLFLILSTVPFYECSVATTEEPVTQEDVTDTEVTTVPVSQPNRPPPPPDRGSPRVPQRPPADDPLGTNGTAAGGKEKGGGGKPGLKAGLIVLLLIGIAILICLVTCFICYVRKGKLMRRRAKEDAKRLMGRRLLRNGSAVHANGNVNGTPAFFLTSETTTEVVPDNRRKIYKATASDHATAAVVCEERRPDIAPGPNERGVDVENRYVTQEEEPDAHHKMHDQPKDRRHSVDSAQWNTNPEEPVYSELDEPDGSSKKEAKSSPTRSTRSDDSTGSTRALYEEIIDTGQDQPRDAEDNYDVIKEQNYLSPTSPSDDEASVIEKFDEALEKYEDENTEKLSTPVKVPKSLRVRRDSWVQDEGDEIDLATLRHQRAESSASNSTTSSPKKSPPESPTRHLSPSTSKDAKSSPSRSSTSGSTRSSSRPSSAKSEIYAKVRKSSVASGGRPSSGRPENKRKHSSGEAAVSKPDGDDEANKGEKDKETDNDPEETNKLHEITCLSLPPLPAGTQKTNTQTDSHTAAPPSAEQVRRNSLLGSLPPLEPVGLETDLTADINVVLGEDTPPGVCLSKRKKKDQTTVSPKHRLNTRKHSVDHIDPKFDKYSRKSSRPRLIKTGSLDEPSGEGADRNVPSDLVFKRSGSLNRRPDKRTGEDAGQKERRVLDELKKDNNTPKGSPSKQRHRAREVKNRERKEDSKNYHKDDSETLEQNVRHKASELVKNAIESATREDSSERNKKSPTKRKEKKNTFKELYELVNWGSGLENGNEKHSSASRRNRRRHSVDDLDSEEEEQGSRSNSRERLTPRSREKRRSKRDSGHVSDDELLSARSQQKCGHGADKLSIRNERPRTAKKEESVEGKSSHHRQRHHRKHRSHRREGESEEEYQRRKRRHYERKKQRSREQHKSHHSRSKGHNHGSNREDDTKRQVENNADMFESGSEYSDEMGAADPNNVLLKSPTKSSKGSPSRKLEANVLMQDLELDNSFEV